MGPDGPAGPSGPAGPAGSDGSPGQMGSAGAPGNGGVGDDVVAGHWQYVSGPMVEGASIDTIEYLELGLDGSGTLFTRSPIGINGCGPLTFAVLDPVLGVGAWVLLNRSA